MKHKWVSLGVSSEIYCNSHMQYALHVWLIGTEGQRLQLDYCDDGSWLYRDSRDFREFHAPQYVEAMFTARFTEMYAANAFAFYEYRKIGDALVKDADPQSLRYHDAEHWQHIADAIMRSAAYRDERIVSDMRKGER